MERISVLPLKHTLFLLLNANANDQKEREGMDDERQGIDDEGDEAKVKVTFSGHDDSRAILDPITRSGGREMVMTGKKTEGDDDKRLSFMKIQEQAA